MTFIRNHWYDLGGAFALIVVAYTWHDFGNLSAYQFLMWVNLISLFLHQLEEYRWPGTFPGTINVAIGKSEEPLRYPLNSNTALAINVAGWLIYLIAALAAEEAVWLGVVAMMISAGNFIAHTIIFNVRGRTVYNAGLITSWILFLPCVVLFVQLLIRQDIATGTDIVLGVAFGILVNVLIPATIFAASDRRSKFSFQPRQMVSAR